MRHVHLILTVDYELFGDGSGCLEPCVLRPAEKMMQIAEQFDAPLTFFTETLELVALEEQLGERHAREQLRHALARGHDVQLHLHPQWGGALFNHESGWQLDLSHWRIGDLPTEEVHKFILQGKQWLEGVIAGNAIGYQCVAFRAGGWCIQPSQHVISAMQEVGFKIDSTVAPGMFTAAKGEWSDFRNSPGKQFWKTDGDVCAEASSGLWEVPIATGKISKMQHLKAVKSSRMAGYGGMAPACRGSYRGPDNFLQDIRGKLGKLTRLGNVMLDFSTMPADVLINVSRQWMDCLDGSEKPIPMVAIAHTKNFTEKSALNLSAYLSWARQEGIRFSLYRHWLEAIGE